MQAWVWILSFLISSACIIKSSPPAREKFIAAQHRGVFDHDILMNKIYDDRWEIGYRFANICPAEFRREEEKLKELITEAMRVWLQPLRGEHSTAPIVDEFLLLPQKDFEESKRVSEEDIRNLRKLDILITFKCESGFSYALTSSKEPPEVYMRQGLVVDAIFIHALVHELGHAFGLLDTYVIPELPSTASTGGLKRTKGKQPSGVMAAMPVADPAREPPYINEDDKRGIIWLYKYIYEGQPLEDCFFPEYIYEAEQPGCRPKNPLIFEIKYGNPLSRTWILDQDPTLDVNAQDENGFTALHYAVMYQQTPVIRRLLAHKDIDPLLRDKDGRSALELAQQEGADGVVALLLTHPLLTDKKETPDDRKEAAADKEQEARSVDPKGKIPLTWGELKRKP